MYEDKPGYEIADAVCEHETSLAILVKAPDLDEPTWFPKSQIHDDSEVWGIGDEGILVITEWLAEQKNWI